MAEIYEANDWRPPEEAPYGTDLLVWWLPIDDNPYAETWTIASRVYRPEPLQTEQGECKTGNWWSGSMYYEPRHIHAWRFLPTPPLDRPDEARRMAMKRAGTLPARDQEDG